MLWNWYTVDACFIARSWQISSSGMFAGSCIGVIFLVISLELLRRSQREFDRYLRRSAPPSTGGVSRIGSDSVESVPSKGSQGTMLGRPVGGTTSAHAPLKLWQQAFRSLLYMLQFAVGYFVMLMAMYYNGSSSVTRLRADPRTSHH
jgi:copper transporter 1